MRYSHLDGIDIVGDDHQTGFLLLHECGDGVDAVPDDGGALGGLVLLAGGARLGPFAEALLALLLRLGTVLVQQLKELGG